MMPLMAQVGRRTALKHGSMALMGLGLGSCASRTSPPVSAPARRLNLPVVRAAWDRVVRTTVGLRPHRPCGFLVAAEKLDHKTIIHNYGHGGAGISTSWGTGYLATELALQQEDRRAAVLGCGAAGLTAARQLQRHGFDVTIYSKSVPPDTTSNMSWAGFTPTSGLLGPGGRTPAWVSQFQRAAEISYRQLQFLVGADHGVSWIDTYLGMRRLPESGEEPEGEAGPSDEAGLLPASLQTGQETLGPGEHPFPSPYVRRGTTIRVEPSVYLDALVRDVELFGARIVLRTFAGPRDLMALGESLIVNCTGLGSRDLFDDQTMLPIKGQLTHLIPQPEIDYSTFGGFSAPGQPGAMAIHMMPRRDGIALGGTSERNVWSMEPNEEARQRVVNGFIQLFGAMAPPVPGMLLRRSMAPRRAPGLDRLTHGTPWWRSIQEEATGTT